MANLSPDPAFDPSRESDNFVARKRAEAEGAHQGFQKAFPADDPSRAEAQPSHEE